MEAQFNAIRDLVDIALDIALDISQGSPGEWTDRERQQTKNCLVLAVHDNILHRIITPMGCIKVHNNVIVDENIIRKYGSKMILPGYVVGRTLYEGLYLITKFKNIALPEPKLAFEGEFNVQNPSKDYDKFWKNNEIVFKSEIKGFPREERMRMAKEAFEAGDTTVFFNREQLDQMIDMISEMRSKREE